MKGKSTDLPIRYAFVALSLLFFVPLKEAPAKTPTVSATDQLLAIEDIQQLKARYLRCMDLKDWVCWEGVFAPDFHFKSGATEWHSAKEMVQATHVSGLFDRVKTVCHAHMPEIEILSPRTARGTWSADFLHYYPADGATAQGHEIVPPGHWDHVDAYYYDTYVKIGGKWYILSEEIRTLRVETGPLPR